MVRKLGQFPPVGLEAVSAAQLLKLMKKLARWGDAEIAYGSTPAGAGTDINVNTVKGWLSRGVVPSDRERIHEFLVGNCTSSEIAEAWWVLLDAAWQRQIEQEARGKEASLAQTRLLKQLQARVLADVRLTRLPALFESDRTLLLADAYVELRLAHARAVAPAPRLLELRPTLTERLQRRTEQRYAIRRSPKDALDQPSLKRRLILGAPGSGKSSLLRRIALDIASGKWATAKLPFFVELRSYALQRRERPSLSLVESACEQLSLPDCDPAAVRELLVGSAASPHAPGILLVDGLDEIASDAELVRSVYHQLAQSTCSWIAMARPAGLVQTLYEDQRFEMVELDRDAVEALIANWCAANAEAGLDLDARALILELERAPGMREMATNPFLLTALCFLKSTAPGEQLPSSRIAVYEALQQRIARQAQLRYADARILAPDVLRAMSGFCCFLYQRPNGVLQIFNISDWLQYTQATGEGVDFERQVLPSRLLNVWHEADPHYHFLHLTLQEHLIAQELLCWTVEQALSHRFAPAWRAVFRFYGALLWHRERNDEFRRLTTALYSDIDINSLSLVTLAEIFADAGIRDTRPWIGDDLRHEIYFAQASADDSGTEAFIDALSVLDPDWLTAKVMGEKDAIIASLFGQFDEATAVYEEGYDGQRYILFGRCLSCSYLHLARARTASALDAVSTTFWGEDQSNALMAAYAYAETATRDDVAKVVLAGAQAQVWSETAQRVFAFAIESRSPRFVAFLARVAEHFAPDGEEPFTEALSLLADIGGTEAAAALEARLLAELARHTKASNQIEPCTRAVVRLGGHAALRIIDTAIASTRSRRWRRFLEIQKFAALPNNDAAITAALEDIEICDPVLSALADAAGYGRLPSETVMTALIGLAAEQVGSQVLDLAVIERSWLDAGRPPRLCPSLYDTLKMKLDAHADGGQPSGEPLKRMIVQLVFEALGKARWTAARPLIEAIIDNPHGDPEVIEAAVEAAGLMLADTGDAEMLERLEGLLYGPGKCDRLAVTLSIGRIELERLFRQQSARTAGQSLQQIAAERDIMIFETFWTDRDGTVTHWRQPPRKVFHIVDVANRETSEIFAHHLSRWALRFDCEDLDGCVAALVFEPLSAAGHPELADEAEALAATSDRFRVIRIPPAIPGPQAEDLARRLGAELST